MTQFFGLDRNRPSVRLQMRKRSRGLMTRIREWLRPPFASDVVHWEHLMRRKTAGEALEDLQEAYAQHFVSSEQFDWLQGEIVRLLPFEISTTEGPFDASFQNGMELWKP